ncbi:TetR/AcrR family transcriptional regulator [Streptomyces sp. GbtcB7]|uniref:TetR/AcrR family transcriptional regulator n=1 Tax=Streptomyces sp. GbtcB7 TaxID=2824752 RepID=UPI001C2F15FA|nr:TetR/AcrR family transcriptional regulator [Streptomyces sp. GbtcB7]
MAEHDVGARSRRRVDADRNHQRILSAACDALVAHGTDVALDDIARRAGVGNATVYRHFPDRRALLHEAASSVLLVLKAEAEAAVANDSDAFGALRCYIHGAAEHRVGALYPALSDLAADGDSELGLALCQLVDEIGGMVARAREAGQLRADVGLADLATAVRLLTRPIPDAGAEDSHYGEAAMHRHLDLFLDGCMPKSARQ